MQVSKPEVISDQLKSTVRAYCFIENRWFTDEENAPLRQAVAEAWSGMLADSVKSVLGTKLRSAHCGAFISIYALPFAASLTQHPEVSRDLVNKYGYALSVGGDGMVGIQLYFVERSAISLNDALGHFTHLLDLKLS